MLIAMYGMVLTVKHMLQVGNDMLQDLIYSLKP